MSLFINALIFIGSAVSIALFLFWILRPYIKPHSLKNDEAIVGYIFSATALVYAVVLAFVVFAVWDRYTTTRAVVTSEAAAVVVAFRDTQRLPEPVRSKAQAEYRNYIQYVMVKEWKSHGSVMKHTSPDPLNSTWELYRDMVPQDASEEAGLSSAESSLGNLESQRHFRHLAGEASLPTIFWPLLIGGGLITVISSYFFTMKSVSAHYILTGILATIIAGVLFLIFSINYPFTGNVRVSQDPFRHALQQFDALNLKSGN
ncbi:MAG TPA: DUF4239 domain-containing protein [Candidatus Limnocylindrales bacterium]|nr:DUF4239 domain-containing protein [Candidatus Limnocylindrales bacterium]